MIYLTEALIDFIEAARPRKNFPYGFQDSYAWHQAVWQAFPLHHDQSRDFLIRLDRKAQGFRLLIVSLSKPNRPEWCLKDQWKTIEIPPTYFKQQRYSFQLRANPTKKMRVGNKHDGTRTKNGTRIPLRTLDELSNWLNRKGQAGGFIIEHDSLQIFPNRKENFTKLGKQGTHCVVDLQGILCIKDPDLFYETFTKGIGSAKAFGFGLLVIAPI